MLTESISHTSTSSSQRQNSFTPIPKCMPTVDGSSSLGMLEVEMNVSDDAFDCNDNGMRATDVQAFGTENMDNCSCDCSSGSDEESEPMDLSEFEDISIVSEQEVSRYILTRKPTRLEVIKTEEMYLAHLPLSYGEGFGTPANAGSPQPLRHVCRHCNQSGPRRPFGMRHHYGCCFAEENKIEQESELDECFNMPTPDTSDVHMDGAESDEAVSIVA